jgi:hypothetical protein
LLFRSTILHVLELFDPPQAERSQDLASEISVLQKPQVGDGGGFEMASIDFLVVGLPCFS